jgi:type VI secretion system protein ImpK
MMEPHVENLAMLYQGAFTAAVRIQAHRQQIGNAVSFRHRMKDVLAEIRREAGRRNYSSSDIAETEFPLVAFLDEMILSSDDACRDDWAKKPLQEDMFGISTAGEQFFIHLDALLARPDSVELMDVLEVYYLCLLLGFQGRYITGGRSELEMHAGRIRQRMERFREVRNDLSLTGALPSEPTFVSYTRSSRSRLGMIAGISAGFAALCFVVFSVVLALKSASVNALLLRSVAP